MDLGGINAKISVCTLCDLHRTRTNVVPGEGDPHAKVVFIGEAPGRNEDLTGRPFCGAAGNILTELLTHIGVRREDVYITSILKCRPPNNRPPKDDEAATCITNNLSLQLEAIDPKIIVLMGNSAIKHIFGKIDIGSEHGKAKDKDGRTYFITYHPAAILYRRNLMDTVKEDFERLKELISND